MHSKTNQAYTLCKLMAKHQILKKENEIIAVIRSHYHLSFTAEPSEADKSITWRITQSFPMIDVRALDHIVIGKDGVSFLKWGSI